MAPNGSLDLPDLSRLFAGEEHILSWYNVPIHTWTDRSPNEQDTTLWRDVLSNEHVQVQIRQDYPSFQTKTPVGAKRLDTATAAINVAPSSDKHYDIPQIKADASWISQELAVNEVQALRVVLLEWQNRPRLHLRAGYSSAEIASLKDVYGSQLGFDARFETSILAPRDEEDFATDSARRRRQVFVHFQECIGLSRSWLALRNQEIANQLRFDESQVPRITESSIQHSMNTLVKQIQQAAEGPKWSVLDDDTNSIWSVGQLFHAQYLMQVVIWGLRHLSSCPAESVQQWFRTLADYEFLRRMEPGPLLSPAELQELHSLVSLTTLALIDPTNSAAQLDLGTQQHWMRSFDVVFEVHQILLNALDQGCLQAMPAAFAWALLLQRVQNRAEEAKNRRDSPLLTRSAESRSFDAATGRRTSMASSVEESLYEQIRDAVRAATPDLDPAAFLLQNTIYNPGVAHALLSMAQALPLTLLPMVQQAKLMFLQELIVIAVTELPDEEAYSENILELQFTVLEPPQSIHSHDFEYIDTCGLFLQSEILDARLFELAAARFPYEALPFLQLCRQLARAEVFHEGNQYITCRLRSLHSFTTVASGPFSNYHTIREDENSNLVALNESTYAFPGETSSLITQDADTQGRMIIEADTEGIVVSGDESRVVKWIHEYSGLSVIGEWLELHCNGLLHQVLATREDPTRVAAEMILLLANLLSTTWSGNKDQAHRDTAVDVIINEASAHVTLRRNVVDLILDILEQELQGYRRRPSGKNDACVLAAALTFARAFLLVKPAKFWPAFAKTSVVNAHRGSSLLYLVMSGIESASRDASITLVASRLYRDIVTAAMQKVPDSSVAHQWRGRPESKTLNNTEKTFEMVLSSMTQNMLEVFESMSQWKHLHQLRYSQIVVNLSHSFDNLIKFRYGIGTTSSALTTCFDSAASLILTRLRPEAAGDAKSGPVLLHLMDILDMHESLGTDSIGSVHQDMLLLLSQTLMNVARTRQLPTSGLELCLFDLAPVFVRVLDALTSDQISTQILGSLLVAVPHVKPVSLLGHLGSESSIDSVNILLTGLSSSRQCNRAAFWRLFDMLISRNQQWLAVVLLTGSKPDKDRKIPSKDVSVYRGRLIIERALDVLIGIDLSPNAMNDHNLIMAVLKFMITAQQNWSWALSSLRTRQEVFAHLVRYVSQTPDRKHTKADALRWQIIALVTDLSSVHLQYAKSVRDLGLMKVFIPLVNWLTTNGIEVSSYNASLHTNLRRNFQTKFHFDLEDLKSNRLHLSEDDEYFDLSAADLILAGNSAWKPQGSRSRSADQSYRAELERANDNLRTVEAELVVLHSFQRFCIEHAAFFVQDANIQKTMAHVIQRCLMANTTKYPAEQLFDSLVQTRCEMALALIQQLVGKKVHGSDYRELLKPAWESAVYTATNYEQALANDDLQCWRTSLSIVLLTLQFHIGTGWKPLASQSHTSADLLKHVNSVMPQIVELVTVVVGKGLATIVSTLQEQKQAEMQQQQIVKTDIGIKDLALVLNIFETVLRLSRLPDVVSQLTERLIATGTTQSALKLYMWSHLLAGSETDNDPVHALYAVRLLASLSALPMVAEEMAIEGILSSILTARVTQVLQQVPGAAGSLDQRQHCRILYTIWAEGILPLALNLLHAVGGPIAAEIATFLNTFPEQLKRASTSLRPRAGDFITLSNTKEVMTLALLSFILEDYRNAGASAAVDPSTILPITEFDKHKKALLSDVREHVELDKNVLKSKIVPTNEKELAWHVDGTLTEKIQVELQAAMMCLKDIDNDETDTATTEEPDNVSGAFGRL
ncbi:hypothetical protein LTR64_004346 [Lithohypha guttulata]|uniref:uncharacterized protein n=1 Tax=Lithohypha guttulata TaxID=1690604 RepID=UPI002DDFDBB7|nr:hypothetical protein LTR51_006359 [Lithohypha guttulata]